VTRIKDVVDDENVAVVNVKTIGANDLQIASLSAAMAITGALNRFKVERKVDFSDEIGDNAKGAFEHHDYNEIVADIVLLDLHASFMNLFSYLLFGDERL
jgi:hypothetical protein